MQFIQDINKLKPVFLFFLFSENNISFNPDKELQLVPDDQEDMVRYPEDEQQLPQPSEQTDETVQQPVESDSRYPNIETVMEETNPQQGTLDFNTIYILTPSSCTMCSY